MKHKHNVLLTICLFVLICSCSMLYAATEPNEQDIQLAKEKMQQLREVYKEVQQAEVELLQLVEEAEREEPLLRPQPIVVTMLQPMRLWTSYLPYFPVSRLLQEKCIR